MFALDGRVALVTGGARGVGRAITIRLAEQGAHVIVNCFHSYSEARQLQNELAQRGLEIEVVRASVARRGHVERMFRELAESHEGLDILVNNAARGSFRDVLTTSEEHLDLALNINLKGSLWCAQEAYPLLRSRPGAAIVNLSSVGAGGVVANYASIGAAKAAVEALTRYLAVEFSSAGIRVNTASAGLVEGEAIDLFPRAEEMQDVAVKTTPLGGLGRAEELADLVLFLASDASRWITGQCIVADGGQSLGGSMLTPPSLWSTRSPSQRDSRRERPRTSGGASVRERDHAASMEADRQVIAVVGAGVVVPSASSPDAFWRVLDDGPELLNEARPDRFRAEAFYSQDLAAEDKTYQTRCGYAEDYTPHPWLAEELGSDPRTTEYTTQWFRHAVYDALREVTLPEGSRCACVMGCTPDGNQHLEELLVVEGILDDLAKTCLDAGWDSHRRDILLREARALLQAHYPLQRAPASTLLPYEGAGQAITGLLPEGTQLITTDTACSSSMYAVDIGVKGILEGKQDLAVCGGSFAVGPRNAVLFAKLRGLSPSGRVRPFDRDGDGVLFADGAAAVTLKRLDLARRDGDKILGYISATGTSSDGAGKAIYAPNVTGQRLAIERALAKAPPAVRRPDWVVAHGTGTPSGDLCEINSIRTVLGNDTPLLVTSNKALVGHTGWAAGVVSLIQVLLSLRNQAILPQHRFTGSPEAYGLDSGTLRVPTEKVPWPPDAERPRVAAVSGFGFGGTNAHLIIQDRPATQPEPGTDDVVIVAWSANFPGFSRSDQTRAWLTGSGPAPELSFGATYDASQAPLRMPPKALRTLDRTQLMAVRCAEDLRHALGDLWDEHRATAGVFLGHMGPTRHATHYAKRCHLDNALTALTRLPEGVALDGDLRDAFSATVRGDVPVSNEDSFPGSMPNMISARVSNHFGLNGANIAIDMGFGSTLGACEVAGRYLRAGDVKIALVGGVNGNSIPVIARITASLSGGENVTIGEGAVMFAVMCRATAESAGLPVLGTLGQLTLGDQEPTSVRRVHCGVTDPSETRPVYLGADSAVAMLRAICRDDPADSGDVTVVAYENQESPPLALPLRFPEQPDQTPATAVTTEPGDRESVSSRSTPPTTQDQSLLLRRHVTSWQPTSGDPVRSAQQALPSDCVIVTATPEILGEIGTRPEDPFILSVAPTEGVRRRHIEELSREGVLSALGPHLDRVSHVRVIADLDSMAASATALDAGPRAFFRLQDAAFLTVQALEQTLREREGSVLGLFMSAWADSALHPYAGLFTGFFKSVALELDPCAVTSVFTSETRLAPALSELVAESRARQHLPVAVYDRGVRHTLETHVEEPGVEEAPVLDSGSVVVAIGGGYGITAELLKAVAARYGPTIYAIGSTPFESLSDELARQPGGESLDDRAKFIQEWLARNPGASVRDARLKYRALNHAAQIKKNLKEMEKSCGQGRVHYLRADVLDLDELQRAFNHVFEQQGKLDLLIHAAGVNRASAISTKSLAQFREVRDVKVQGYLNIRAALRDRTPRIWCSFASLIALTGQLGETDYAAANDFLATAAAHNRQIAGRDEFAVGWTLWKEVGMAASSVHQSFFTGIRGNILTLMPTAEGKHHFLAELQGSNRTSAMFLLGEIERSAIERILPGYLNDRRPVTPSSAVTDRGTFYVDRVQRDGADRLVVERQFDTDRDDYLDHHSVRGTPTLPGCFVTELAADAAAQLAPELKVIGFRDVAFSHFLKLGGATDRSPRRVIAQVRRRTAAHAVVDVRVVGDVLSPSGVLLTRDRLHFSATVVMADRYPEAPHLQPWPGAPEHPIVDPYHVPGGPVSLTGPFVSSVDTRLHPLGKRARYTKPAEPGSVFERFLVPALLLDGLARLAVLEIVNDRYIPVAAPTRIRRIDLHVPDNDVDLGRRDEPIDLSVTPRGLLFEETGASCHFFATLPDGRALIQMKDVSGFSLGRLDVVTGRHDELSAVESGSITRRDALPL